MRLVETGLRDVKIIAGSFPDRRGYFFESFNVGRYRNAGISEGFVQDNVSASFKGVLRGLHLQTQRRRESLSWC